MALIVNHAWYIFGLALSLLVLCFIPVVIELVRIVRDFRMVADRIEMLTDIRGWLTFAKKFKRKGSCEKRHKWRA